MGARSRTALSFDGIEFEPREVRLYRAGACIELQPKVSRLLELLVAQAGQLVTKEELMDRLWPQTFVNEEALTQLVRKLRKALADDVHEPRYIQTVTGRGYRFLPEVVTSTGPAGVPEVVPAPTDVADAPVRPEQPPPRTVEPRWALWSGVAVGLAAVALISVSRWQRGGERPSRLRLGETTVRRLTFTSAHKQDPAFTPDGRLVLFAANDPEQGQLDLYACQTHGSTPLRLTATRADEFYPQVTPDGETVVFSRVDAADAFSVMAMPVLGGAERILVADAAYGTPSPAGGELAYSRRGGDGRWHVLRREMTGGAEREVARSDREVTSLAWSPDGRTLAWTDGASLLTVEASGGPARPVGDTGAEIRSLAWEADGRALLCDANWGGRSDVWRVEVPGGRREAVTGSSGSVFHPSPSRDGRHLIYAQESKEHLVFAVGADGRGPRLIPTKSTSRCLDVDVRGRWLAYTDDEPATGPGRMGIVALSGGTPRELAIGGECPVFAPRGDALAFVSRTVGGDALMVMGLAASAPTEVLPARRGRTLGRPAWSHDGRLAVPIRGGESGSGLLVIGTDGGAGRQVASGDFRAPSWAPRGDRIAASGRVNGVSGFWLVEVASGETRRLCEEHSFSAAPIFTPDGRGLWVLADERSRPRLLTLDMAGNRSGPDVVLEHPAEAGFWGIFEVLGSSDGGFIYVMERYEADLFLVEPARAS
jgi:Tol biopolymer transport system component/DNA-binding winged helix-turn-helix (wHTH) protein